MKTRHRVFTIITLIVFTTCFASLAEKATQHDMSLMTCDELKQPRLTAIFKPFELLGGIAGIVTGNRSACVYSDTAYLIVDEQWNIIFRHSINHPDIQCDIPFINHVLYKNDVYYLLVFDHSTHQSYIIAHPTTNEPQYGKTIYKEIFYFDTEEDIYLMTGLDEKLSPWTGGITSKGETLWEIQSVSNEFIPKYGFIYDGKFYLINNSPCQAAFLVTIVNRDGQIMTSKEFQFPTSSLQVNTTHFDFFHMDVSSKGIALFGQQLSYNDCFGLYIYIDAELNLIQFQLYNQYRRIQSAVPTEKGYLMLALSHNELGFQNSKHIINEDAVVLYPLERQPNKYIPVGIVSDSDNHLYIFGLLFEADYLPEPSAFISKMILE